MVRKTNAYWFYESQPIEEHYTVQMDWFGLRAKMEKRLEDTTIGWTWMQRRGSVKHRPSRLRYEIGSDIEIYRKPSILTRADIQPPELIGWEAPVERKLSQLNLTRAQLAEKPLWDIWVRIKPPATPSVFQDRKANAYIRDATAQDSFQARHDAEVLRLSKLTQEELDVEENVNVPWRLEQAKEALHFARSDRLIALRENHRYGKEKPEDRLARLRNEAIEVHRARIEAGRARTERMLTKREGKS